MSRWINREDLYWYLGLFACCVIHFIWTREPHILSIALAGTLVFPLFEFCIFVSKRLDSSESYIQSTLIMFCLYYLLIFFIRYNLTIPIEKSTLLYMGIWSLGLSLVSKWIIQKHFFILKAIFVIILFIHTVILYRFFEKSLLENSGFIFDYLSLS